MFMYIKHSGTTTDLPRSLYRPYLRILFCHGTFSKHSLEPQHFEQRSHQHLFCIYKTNNWPKQQQHLHKYLGDLQWVHGNPLHTFMTEGLGWSLQALPAGFFVPYHTHCRIRYLMPCVSQGAAHCTCTQACMLKTNKCLC